MALLTEEKTNKPSLWKQALKTVKGDSTTELVEQFTQEMTLVAEGLCEDQARLRKTVDALIRETDGQKAKSEQDYQDVLRQMENHQKDTDRRLEELSRRVAALEKPAGKGMLGRFHLGGDMMSRITVLVGLVCATVLIVTILKLFM